MKGTRNPLRRFPGVALTAYGFFVYLYLPIVVLLVLSFNANRTATIWTGFSFDWYGIVLSNPDIIRAAKNSLVVASIATVVATVFATMAALAMARHRFLGQSAVTGLVALPLVVPEIVTAVATLLFFVMIGMRLGLATVIIAHTVFCIPFAYLPIRARLEGMDKALTEAAADLYANPWQAFRRVTLPLLWPGILSGAMLSFIISLDDFVITYFVAGAGATTLPVYIFGMIRIGISPEVNAISTVMLVISVAFVSLSYLFARRR
ncbi:MAG TPA: ABC transporter permease [Alphaproteobacteria bacterium]|nr:ABC transporter permease [Alphaproteobacteria bacterium]